MSGLPLRLDGTLTRPRRPSAGTQLGEGFGQARDALLDTPVAGPYSLRSMGHGIRDAIGMPMAGDAMRGNLAIKQLREEYPTVDNIAGIHPMVAGAQVANDALAGQADGGTLLNAAQAVPVLKGMRGMQALLSKQAGATLGGTRYVVDAPATIKKNIALTGAQVLGQPAQAR